MRWTEAAVFCMLLREMNELSSGLIGLIPLVLLLIGLGFTRLPSHRVAVFSAMVAALLAWGGGWHAAPGALGRAACEGAVVALIPILWVIFGAVFVFLVCTETRGVAAFRRFIAGVSPNRSVQVVLIAFCLGGFLEAVAGFGSAVAVPVGILIVLGIEPVRATVICLVANSVPVAFGALGIPLLALVNVTGIDTAILTRHVALQLSLFAVAVPTVLVLMAGGGWQTARRALPDALFI